jgi:hypothetical protein
MRLRIPSLFAASLVLLVGLFSAGCECIDCNRAGPTIGYVRALVQEENASPVAGASIHLENRVYITEPRLTNVEGVAVLLVYMEPQASDTGTVTVAPPAGFELPAPQRVTIPAGDTVSLTFSLRRL